MARGDPLVAAPHRLLRHPAPDTAAGVCYGRLDVPLRDGWHARLEALLPSLDDIQGIVASPSQRCRAPAAWLAERLGLALACDARLMELDFGAWEGRRWEDIDGPEARAWAADPLHRAPPGGETLLAMRARVLAALADIEASPHRCLLVTHGGPIRVLLCHHQGRPPGEAFRLQPDFATLYRFTDQPPGG